MVALLTSVRNSPCFGGLRRTKTCHRQLFARPSMLFGYFLHDAKSDNPFSLAGSFEVLQTSKSAHRNGSFALQQLKPFYGSFEVLQTSNQRTKQQLRTIQLNPFAAPRLLPAAMPPFLLPAATDRRPWRLFFPPYGGLRRTKTCHRQLFARPSNIFFCRLRGRIATLFKAAP